MNNDIHSARRTPDERVLAISELLEYCSERAIERSSVGDAKMAKEFRALERQIAGIYSGKTALAAKMLVEIHNLPDVYWSVNNLHLKNSMGKGGSL